MQMKTVTIVRITVQNMNIESLARPGVEHATWNSPVPGRLVHIRVDEHSLVRDRKVRVHVFPVNERVQGRAQDFIARNTAVIMARIKHTVAAVALRAYDRRERAVAGQRFDLEKDIASAEFHVEDLHFAQ